ncbi:hypothetical protein Aple_013540 [Acrocarpospora pleiomorpha]|uniref:Uncharacterized protein n=1 Tax=Acrocarpospora pleiomorpha TaxID=90975 RepID=A0A5M3XE64_9ACTN|nr:hypothetical protein [Acrocarpospora pleiomorpha]GES18459.1 hypothetical protein Aple_013540 [Acrocarpospora pleiomorpha]
MAGHELIDRELAILARRLPPMVVEELADGLDETYHSALARYRDPEAAARAALAEFGDADIISAAFVAAAPGRGTARFLMAAGPVVGACWATVLMNASPAVGEVPFPARLTAGLLLGGVILALLTAVRTRHRYRAARRGALAGATGLAVLDLAMLSLAWPVDALAGVPSWLMACAAAASLTRILVVVRAMPDLLNVR